MGFFQNLKEDYEAAVDELLGSETGRPEEEPAAKKSRGRKKSAQTEEETDQVALD